MTEKLAFLGVGNMASAIINGVNAETVYLYDKLRDKCEAFADRGYITVDSASEAVKCADYIFIAVKPQNIPELFGELKASGCDISGKLFISIVAGLPISAFSDGLGCECAVVRTMPNTPMMIGMGVTALTRNELVSDEDFEKVCSMFRTVSEIIVLPEDKMNAIISVTSSAPAYVYLFIESIRKSAEAQGIDDPETLSLICSMVQGSAEMLRRSDKTPAELIRMVTSPGGTTERAMNVFAERDLEGIINEAMIACTKRAEELSSVKSE